MSNVSTDFFLQFQNKSVKLTKNLSSGTVEQKQYTKGILTASAYRTAGGLAGLFAKISERQRERERVTMC